MNVCITGPFLGVPCIMTLIVFFVVLFWLESRAMPFFFRLV
jgi:hypothetical protein